MARLVNINGIERAYIEVVRHATKYIVLLSPYLGFSSNYNCCYGDEFYGELEEVMSKNPLLNVIVFCRHYSHCLDFNKENHKEYMGKLRELGCYVICCNNLHSKGILNEKRAVISSMNIFHGSTNHELGLELFRDDWKSMNNNSLWFNFREKILELLRDGNFTDSELFNYLLNIIEEGNLDDDIIGIPYEGYICLYDNEIIDLPF